MDDLRRIAQEWIGAFNSHDVDRLLALYRDDAAHYSPRVESEQPETGGWLRGKERLRAWWQRSFDDLPSLRYDLRHVTTEAGRVLMDYHRTVEGEPPKEVMEYLLVRGGLIAESRVLRSWLLSE